MRHRPSLVLALALLAIAVGVLLQLDWRRGRLSPIGPRLPAPVEAGRLEGRARVIDGDTIEVAGRRVRLHGIDAPERDQACERGGRPYACGEAASRALADLLAGRAVRCVGRGQDQYGRVIAVCQSGGADLGEAMVRAGWAVAYRRYAKDYAPAEAAARRAGAGLWAGRFDAPEDWRRRSPSAER